MTPKPFRGLSIIFACSLLVLGFFCLPSAGAQPVKSRALNEIHYYTERPLKGSMPAAAARTVQRQNALLESQGRRVEHKIISTAGTAKTSSACGTCQDMGVENGWSFWQAEAGDNIDTSGLSLNAPGAPSAPQFNITSGPGIDSLTPGINPGDPAITLVAPPGFGSSSIQLGQRQTDGFGGGCTVQQQFGQRAGCAERLTYCFTVGLMDTNFTYAYAFVMENPDDSSHTEESMPFVEFMLLDQNGDTVPCAYQRFIASVSFPGQYTCNEPRLGSNGGGGQQFRDTAIYKPWTIEGVNLTNYIGQTLTVVITNADCRLGGHFSHSYWDFNCGSNSAIVKPNCYANAPDTLVAPAPADTVNQYSYLWFRNNDPNPVGNTQVITPFAQNGDTFIVKISTAAGCSWYNRYVPQHYSLSTDFSFSTGCGFANFTDLTFTPSSDDPINYWSWNFASGAPLSSGVANPSAISFPPGDHVVTLISGTYSAGCRDTIQKTVRVPQFPVADFQVTDVCAGDRPAFDNISTVASPDTISSYAWSLPGANPSTFTGFEPQATYNTPDTFPVALIVTSSSGCRDTVTRQLTVKPKPVARFSASSFCLGGQFQPANTTLAVPAWDSVLYNWTFTGGTPSFSQDEDPVIDYSAAGSSVVTLIASSISGCADTLIDTINVHPLPLARFSSPLVCYLTPLRFENSSAAVPGDSLISYQWSIPGAQPAASTVFEPLVTYGSIDTFDVTLVVTTVNGCKDTVQSVVYAKPDAEASFAASSICLYDTLNVLNNSVSLPSGYALTYQWQFPGGSPEQSSDESPVVQFSSPDTVPVTLVVTAPGGCMDSVTRNVLVYPVPQAAFSAQPVCLGDPTQLVNTSLAAAGDSIPYHRWTFIGATPELSSALNPVVRYDTAGVFDVRLVTTTRNGCSDTMIGPVTVYRPPVAAVSLGNAGCVPVCYPFADLSQPGDSAITVWTWSFPGGLPDRSSDQNPGTVCYDVPGTYNVSLEVEDRNGCRSSISRDSLVTAYENPVADFSLSSDNASYLTPVFWFNDQSSSSVVQWRWDFGDGSAAVTAGPDVSHSYGSSVTGNNFYNYNTTLIVTTANGCVDTISRPLDITPDFTFFIPNSFTPNGDGRNASFYGKGIGVVQYEMWVFDRWGLQIYYCKESGSNIPYDLKEEEGLSSLCKWDGTYFGKTVEQDVYVWKVRLTDIFGREHSYLGHVSVVY